VHIRQQNRIDLFTHLRLRPTLPLVAKVTLSRSASLYLRFSAALILIAAVPRVAVAQEPAQKTVEKPPDKKGEKTAPSEKTENPAQIELLETRYRFETDGSSRKEVHTRVHINSELGVRQFARLNFDFNRAFQSIEIPLVHITHASGGTADILPSAITDNPNPAVVNAPAYQDVRVKSVRILGLEPGDTLEYRVITTVSHHPLAPDFWLDHSFDRTGIVTHEVFELDLPASRFEGAETTDSHTRTPEDPAGLAPPASEHLSGKDRPRLGAIYVSPKTAETSREKIREGETTRLHYLWNTSHLETSQLKPSSESVAPIDSDVVVTTFSSWEAVAYALSAICYSRTWPPADPPSIEEKRKELLAPLAIGSQPDETIYDFVSQKISTVDLALASNGFRARSPSDTLSSGYGTPTDKAALLIALLGRGKSSCGFVPDAADWQMLQLYRPALFGQILVYAYSDSRKLYLDPSLEVAPFGLIRSDLRGRDALMPADPAESIGQIIIGPANHSLWRKIPRDPPFPASQRVNVEATLVADGTLSARVHYALRGDNELLLRVAFHKSPKAKWKDLAQLLSLSDGFRGEVASVSASDPDATREPFTVDYEISMPKFVHWSKKPVRIPALLPQLGLPDPPAKPAAGVATAPVELGTPLEVETHMTLHLPPGTIARTPTGISVVRDYATFASQYDAKEQTVSASRHINFLSREVPAERAADYNAFLRAVQSDEAQDFTLERPDSATAKPAPAAEKPPAPKP
jgi:Domain of Unknown Function with PDB structure (DUF3857)